MAKLVNVSGRDLLVNSRRTRGSGGVRTRVGGVCVKAGQAYDVGGEAVDVGDAYKVGDLLYPKKTWSLMEKKVNSGKADGAKPDSEKE